MRTGARAAKVQARFDAPDGAEEWAEDGEVILARRSRPRPRLGADRRPAHDRRARSARWAPISSRSTASTGPSGCSTARPRRRSWTGSRGREHVDRADATARRTSGLLERRREHDALLEAARDRERELDLLAYQVREIEAVAPQPGESARSRRGGSARPRRAAARPGRGAAGLPRRRRRRGRPARDGGAATWRRAELDPGCGRARSRARSRTGRRDRRPRRRGARLPRAGRRSTPSGSSEVRERIAALKACSASMARPTTEVVAFLDASARRRSRRSRPPTSAWPTLERRGRGGRGTVSELAEAAPRPRGDRAPGGRRARGPSGGSRHARRLDRRPGRRRRRAGAGGLATGWSCGSVAARHSRRPAGEGRRAGVSSRG